MNLAIVPQIFGNWHIPPATESQLKKADCIVGFSFGLRENSQPGLSNKALAKIVTKLHRQYPDKEVMVQWEIADCLPFDLRDDRIVRKHRIKGEYLDTYQVATQMQDLLWDPHTKPIVVAHPLHMWRCLKTLEALNFKNPVPADTSNVPYDPLSIQKWTRSNLRFAPREILGRCLYLAKGLI